MRLAPQMLGLPELFLMFGVVVSDLPAKPGISVMTRH
jgi:hypothetical protein